MGKTTLSLKIIEEIFLKRVDRILFVCPTYFDQQQFRRFDPYINPKNDVFLNALPSTFTKILVQLREQKRLAQKFQKKEPVTLMFVDDMAGEGAIHGGRQSPFSHLSIQSPHLNLSMICISQQYSAITPGFRDNINALISFPSSRKADRENIINSFGGCFANPKILNVVMDTAWTVDEKGPHFLFVYVPARQNIRLFIDFDKEIIPNEA